MAKKINDGTTKWRGRFRKSYQDRQPTGQRERVQEQDRRVAWMQNHHPATSEDWIKYRS